MRRYFFDVIGQQGCAYDYRGRDFPTPEKLYQLAELIALDCSIEEEDEWCGCTVNVCSAEGHELFSIPVKSSCLAAA
jgi:hypothetical protein